MSLVVHVVAAKVDDDVLLLGAVAKVDEAVVAARAAARALHPRRDRQPVRAAHWLPRRRRLDGLRRPVERHALDGPRLKVAAALHGHLRRGAAGPLAPGQHRMPRRPRPSAECE
eukprot:1822693-Prymnesium_polylepis.1